MTAVAGPFSGISTKGASVAVPDDAIAVHLPVHVIWNSSPIVLPRLRVTIDAIVARARTAMER